MTPAEDAAAALARPLREAIPESWLDILDESIKHRGPDGQGRFRDRVVRGDGSVVDVALVHRRLSIIDHAGGAQPMVSVRGGGGRGEGAPSASSGGMGGVGGVGGACVAPLVFHGRPDDAVVYRPVRGAGHPELALGAPSDVVAVVFNGCIYNHRELRNELRAAGHEFVSDHSDTEVLVHGWREWGEDLPNRLDGMFAFAIWDRTRAQLFAGRDIAGEKPLFLSEGAHDGRLVLSSVVTGAMRITDAIDENLEREPSRRFLEDRAKRLAEFERLRASGEVVEADPPGYVGNGWRSQRVEPSWLDSWIQFGRSCNTPIPPVITVMPRSLCRMTELNDGYEIVPHGTWGSRGGRVFGARLNADVVDGMLAAAVESRLEADVPLACLLSGGIDSSLVALYAARRRPDLATLTVRMPDARFDESGYAERVAAQLGTRHTTLDCEADPAGDLQFLITQLGLPLGDSSLLPQYWVCRAAARQARVVLTGDGGDELFGGYDRHTVDGVLRRWWWAFRWLPASLLPARQAKAPSSRLVRLIHAARHGGYPQLSTIFDEPAYSRLRARPIPAWRRTSLAVRDGLTEDFLDYLPYDLLCKTDTASMAVGLELRAPLLSRELVRACLTEPLSSLMPNGQRKGLLRQVARKYLPAEIVDRPKMGFAIPIGEWFRTDYGGMRTLLYDRLSSREPFGPDSLGINGMINMDFVRTMLREHDAAGARSVWPWKGRDHSQRLYMLLVLSIWGEWLGRVGRE